MGREEPKLAFSEKRLITAVIFYFLNHGRIPTTVKLAPMVGHSRHRVTEIMGKLVKKGYIYPTLRSQGVTEGQFRLTDAGEEAYRRDTDGYEAEARRYGFISDHNDLGNAGLP